MVYEDRYNDQLVDGFSILEDVLFAVRGETPTDQFNFIRIIPTGVKKGIPNYPNSATQVTETQITPVVHRSGCTNSLQTQT